MKKCKKNPKLHFKMLKSSHFPMFRLLNFIFVFLTDYLTIFALPKNWRPSGPSQPPILQWPAYE